MPPKKVSDDLLQYSPREIISYSSPPASLCCNGTAFHMFKEIAILIGSWDATTFKHEKSTDIVIFAKSTYELRLKR